jgi:hypothetical protein
MTFAQIISYIERVAIARKDLTTSYVGDYEKIYDLIKNPDHFALPALWIETPELTFIGNADSIKDSWQISCVVLRLGSDSAAGQESKYQAELAFRTARAVALRIEKDSSEGLVQFDLVNKSLTPIDPYTGDQLVGWRINLEIRARVGTPCYIEDEWEESIAVNSELSFKLAATETGYTATREDSLDSAWTYSWKYSIGGAALQSSSDTVLTLTTDQKVYVQLTATHTATSLTRICTANEPGLSVPFIYNQFK